MFKLSRLYEAMDDAFNIRYYRMTKQKKSRENLQQSQCTISKIRSIIISDINIAPDE